MLNTKFNADARYFNQIHMPLLRLARGRPKRVLEIGCAAGQSLIYFKQHGAEWVAGVELSPEVAERARARPEIDEIITGNIEDLELSYPAGSVDLIIASHVLEHTADPWAVLRKLRPLLRPQGRIIGTLPNIRHLSVLLPLLFLGRWRYEEAGILDWTHLRFFSRDTVVHLLQSTGFRVERVTPQIIGWKSTTFNVLTLGLLRNLCGFAYNFSAIRAD
ncbi:MAG: class I SAM-dependent methyltransferase [Armatimonadetes bacterium]|nr:class I SAM-dependent methyltransferase [Armatimonadota bacterium]